MNDGGFNKERGMVMTFDDLLMKFNQKNIEKRPLKVIRHSP